MSSKLLDIFSSWETNCSSLLFSFRSSELIRRFVLLYRPTGWDQNSPLHFIPKTRGKWPMFNRFFLWGIGIYILPSLERRLPTRTGRGVSSCSSSLYQESNRFGLYSLFEVKDEMDSVFWKEEIFYGRMDTSPSLWVNLEIF